jgi:hypothetical protein
MKAQLMQPGLRSLPFNVWQGGAEENSWDEVHKKVVSAAYDVIKLKG